MIVSLNHFLATWNDPTESLSRLPWQKQANGTWKQLKTPNAKEGGENTYYEDKFAQIWNINTPSFDASGCMVTCHSGENSDVKDFGNKYTSNYNQQTSRLRHIGYLMIRSSPLRIHTRLKTK